VLRQVLKEAQVYDKGGLFYDRGLFQHLPEHGVMAGHVHLARPRLDFHQIAVRRKRA
jgi:hypothetical protein